MLASRKIFLLWLVAELHKHFGVSSVVLREENPVPQRFLLNWNQAKLLFLGRTLLSNSRCEMQRVYSLRNRSLSYHDLASSESFRDRPVQVKDKGEA